MQIEIQQQLKLDFEKYMTKFYQANNRFSIEDFGNFATTVLNYYVNNQVLEPSEKKEAAYWLTTLFNIGLGNRISEEHLQLISTSIAADHTVDFNVVSLLFG